MTYLCNDLLNDEMSTTSRHLLSSSFIVDDIMADYFLQTETRIRLFNIINRQFEMKLSVRTWQPIFETIDDISVKWYTYLFFGTNLPT